MNATIMAPDLIKCDSPTLPRLLGTAVQGFSDSHAPFYFIAVTLNGVETSNSNIKFIYYVDPFIWQVHPHKGPLKGGTVSKLTGHLFDQEGSCNVTVRYGPIQQKITNVTNYTDSEIIITSPPATYPDSVVLSISLNGQQFINDLTLHYRDPENTFVYYQELLL